MPPVAQLLSPADAAAIRASPAVYCICTVRMSPRSATLCTVVVCGVHCTRCICSTHRTLLDQDGWGVAGTAYTVDDCPSVAASKPTTVYTACMYMDWVGGRPAATPACPVAC